MFRLPHVAIPRGRWTAVPEAGRVSRMRNFPWFRMYGEFATDPSVQILSFEDQRHFVMILCMKTSGLLDKPYSQELRARLIASTLGLDSKTAGEVNDRLTEVGLIREDWHPINWDKRQYKSDSAAERVKRYRQRRARAGLAQQSYIRPDLRSRVFQRDDHKCVNCGSNTDLTIDHILPELQGGTNEINNLQCLCRKCNAGKRDLDNVTFQKRNSVTHRVREQNTDTEDREEGFAPPPGLDWESFSKWEKYRAEIGKPLAPASLFAAQRKLVAFGKDQAAVVEQSIANGWHGLFGLKVERGASKASWVPPKSIAELEAEEAARGR